MYKDYWTERAVVKDGIIIDTNFMKNTSTLKVPIGKHHQQIGFILKLLPTFIKPTNISITPDSNIPDILQQYKQNVFLLILIL